MSDLKPIFIDADTQTVGVFERYIKKEGDKDMVIVEYTPHNALRKAKTKPLNKNYIRTSYAESQEIPGVIDVIMIHSSSSRVGLAKNLNMEDAEKFERMKKEKEIHERENKTLRRQLATAQGNAKKYVAETQELDQRQRRSPGMPPWFE